MKCWKKNWFPFRHFVLITYLVKCQCSFFALFFVASSSGVRLFFCSEYFFSVSLRPSHTYFRPHKEDCNTETTMCVSKMYTIIYHIGWYLKYLEKSIESEKSSIWYEAFFQLAKKINQFFIFFSVYFCCCCLLSCVFLVRMNGMVQLLFWLLFFMIEPLKY